MLSAAFGSDKPDLGMTEMVKNKELQKIIDPSIKRAVGTGDQVATDIAEYLKRFEANTPELEKYQKQGIGVLDQFFNGQFETQLAGLRGKETEATRAATDRTINKITGADKSRRARLGLPGSNSFLDFSNARLMRDTNVDQALRESAAERSDFASALQMRLGNLGTRQAMQAGYERRPIERSQVMAGAETPLLQQTATLQQLDDANKFRSVYRKRGALERLSDMEAVGMEQLGQLVDMAGSVAGMAGGLCWVAQAVYGADNPRWLLFRHWLLTRAPDSLFHAYALAGRLYAERVLRSGSLRDRVRRWMDCRISELH